MGRGEMQPVQNKARARLMLSSTALILSLMLQGASAQSNPPEWRSAEDLRAWVRHQFTGKADLAAARADILRTLEAFVRSSAASASPRLKAQALIIIAKLKALTSGTKSAWTDLEAAKNLLSTVGDSRLEAHRLTAAAELLKSEGKEAPAIELFRKAREVARSAGDRKGEAEALVGLSFMYDDTAVATALRIQASELDPTAGYISDSERSSTANDRNHAAEQLLAALREKKRPFDFAAADAVEILVNSHEHSGRIEEAKALRREALGWAITDPVSLLLQAVNASDLFVRHGSPEEALRTIQTTREKLAAFRAPMERNLQLALEWNEGEAYLKLGRGAEAVQLLENSKTELDGMQVLAEAHALVGNHRKAYEYLQEYLGYLSKQERGGSELLLHEFRERSEREASLQLMNQAVESSRRMWLAIGFSVALLAVIIGAALAWRARVARRTAAAVARMNERLHELASRDALTGLHNRGHFMSVVDSHVAAARRIASGSEHQLDLLFFLIDLDHFKKVNDTHGHGAGDAVLQQAAQRLRNTMRAEDLVVRWGGEEFLVMTRGTPREQAPQVADRIRVALAATPMQASPALSLRQTCSIGFAPFPLVLDGACCTSWQAVVELADQALYCSKQQGRNGWTGIQHSSVDFSEGVPAGGLAEAVRQSRCVLTQGFGHEPPLVQGEPASEQANGQAMLATA